VPCGTTAMKGRPSSLAKNASLMAVDPDDASTMGVPGPISPLHRPYRNSERASRRSRLPAGWVD